MDCARRASSRRSIRAKRSTRLRDAVEQLESSQQPASVRLEAVAVAKEMQKSE